MRNLQIISEKPRNDELIWNYRDKRAKLEDDASPTKNDTSIQQFFNLDQDEPERIKQPGFSFKHMNYSKFLELYRRQEPDLVDKIVKTFREAVR